MRTIPTIIALGRVAAFVFLATCLGACGSRFNFVGLWTGSRESKGATGTPSYVMTTINAIKLEIQPNGQFRLQDMGVLKEGNIAYSGDKATLTITKIAGVPVDRQSQATVESLGAIELTVQPVDFLIYHDPKSLDPTPVQLKRIATPVKNRP